MTLAIRARIDVLSGRGGTLPSAPGCAVNAARRPPSFFWRKFRMGWISLLSYDQSCFFSPLIASPYQSLRRHLLPH